MAKGIGTALLGAMMLSGVSAICAPAVAASAGVREKPPLQATDIGARRRVHYDRRYAYRPYPAYYGRPVTYAPAPFIPLPPLWGYGWEWW